MGNEKLQKFSLYFESWVSRFLDPVENFIISYFFLLFLMNFYHSFH